MEKLKWKYNKKEKTWGVTKLLHPTILIKKGADYFHKSWILHFSGRVIIDVPFSKVSTAKKVAELILNG
jgi:hypothetical protein